LGFVAKQLKEFDVANIGKWDWSLVWHIFNNDKCLPPNEWHEVSWTHLEKEVEKICVVFQWKNMACQIVPWEIRLAMVFFYKLEENTSRTCVIEGAIWESISNLKGGEYLYHWHKAIDILKHDGH
jgi:hypothetical protein